MPTWRNQHKCPPGYTLGQMLFWTDPAQMPIWTNPLQVPTGISPAQMPTRTNPAEIHIWTNPAQMTTWDKPGTNAYLDKAHVHDGEPEGKHAHAELLCLGGGGCPHRQYSPSLCKLLHSYLRIQLWDGPALPAGFTNPYFKNKTEKKMKMKMEKHENGNEMKIKIKIKIKIKKIPVYKIKNE
jgi:hypothetical protein